MEAEDLVVLADALPGQPLEPVREPLVERRPEFLGCRSIRGLTDEDVTEAERRLVDELGLRRADELLLNKRFERVAHGTW
jgi:hypothetical protein